MSGTLPGVHKRARDFFKKALVGGVPDDSLAAEAGNVVAGAAAGIEVQAGSLGQVAAVRGAGVDDVLAMHSA